MMVDPQAVPAQEPAEGGAGTPGPEKGSPVPGSTDRDDDGDGDDDVERRRDEGETGTNPLAPPINIGAGS